MALPILLGTYDPNGVVIGRDLRGEDLTRVLNEKIK